jgi:lysophospholipase L1-like esterase
MQIAPNSKLVMIGDSITDAGRDHNNGGEGLFNSYGNGYVALVQALLHSRYPAHRIRVVNKGISGNDVRDLDRRWQKDVLNQEPDWVSVMIGINDVWRQFDVPQIAEQHVPLDAYRETLGRLVGSTRPQLSGMVVAAPYYIESQRGDAMRTRMDEYAAVAAEIAADNDCLFVDVQAAFDAYLAHFHSAQLAWDRVHPNTTGHMIIARAWLDAVGFTWADS